MSSAESIVSELSLRAADHIKSVLSGVEGSGRKEPVGSAFVFYAGDGCVVVTAKHVLARRMKCHLALLKRASFEWPRSHVEPEPIPGRGAKDCDIAYFTAKVVDKTLSGFSQHDILPNWPAPAGARFIAIGKPHSRNNATYRAFNSTLRSRAAIIRGPAASQDSYARLGVDPRTHIVIEYDPSHPDSRNVGPQPGGMSGGVLLAAVEVESAGVPRRATLGIVGVLIEYHQAPTNLLVASRIDNLLDSFDPHRPESERFYRRADV